MQPQHTERALVRFVGPSNGRHEIGTVSNSHLAGERLAPGTAALFACYERHNGAKLLDRQPDFRSATDHVC
jgi:hypothetical protein